MFYKNKSFSFSYPNIAVENPASANSVNEIRFWGSPLLADQIFWNVCVFAWSSIKCYKIRTIYVRISVSRTLSAKNKVLKIVVVTRYLYQMSGKKSPQHVRVVETAWLFRDVLLGSTPLAWTSVFAGRQADWKLNVDAKAKCTSVPFRVMFLNYVVFERTLTEVTLVSWAFSDCMTFYWCGL